MKVSRDLAAGSLLVMLCIGYCQRADGASVEVFFEFSKPDSSMVKAGVPANATIMDGFATTDADILSIGKVLIESSEPLFNVDPPFGSDTGFDLPFLAVNPLWLADSWITTPGDTWLLGPGLEETDGTSTWGDLSNDGAQNRFQFARLTFLPGTLQSFSGQVTLRGDNGPESFPFSIVVPEPTGLALCAVLLIVLSLRRDEC